MLNLIGSWRWSYDTHSQGWTLPFFQNHPFPKCRNSTIISRESGALFCPPQTITLTRTYTHTQTCIYYTHKLEMKFVSGDQTEPSYPTTVSWTRIRMITRESKTSPVSGMWLISWPRRGDWVLEWLTAWVPPCSCSPLWLEMRQKTDSQHANPLSSQIATMV